MKTYEWAVIGSGIAGISIAEILTRQGHSVVLVEKNDTLASETTRDFHRNLMQKLEGLNGQIRALV